MNTQDYQENYSITDFYGMYPPEDAYRLTKDILMEEWLRNFYMGKVEEVKKSDYCLRHQHSYKGNSCDQCSH